MPLPLRLEALRLDDLERPLGHGAMATVWRGFHPQAGLVAVKVLNRKPSSRVGASSRFRNELRAAAGLDHPSIAALVEFGTVPAETAAASGGRLVTGASYVAMELATDGNLGFRCGKFDWTRSRQVLICLLDALAHAHARGIIHRDVKPANVLLGGERSPVLLTDFGLARVIEDEETVDDQYVAGTPAYMAPEQLEGNWRDLGPWTDLYALGATAWALLTGKRPFSEQRISDALANWKNRVLPEFKADPSVPAGVSDWLRRMLALDAGQRFQSAAAAAARLLALDAPGPGVPSLPTTWRQSVHDVSSFRLRYSLSLHHLRTVRLVGRKQERDVLWSAAARVLSRRQPVLVHLHGPAGFGKTRLADWLSLQLSELGLCTVLRISHLPVSGPNDALAEALARYFRCQGMDRIAGAERVVHLLSALRFGTPDERDAVANFVCPEPVPSVDAGRAEGALQAVVRLLGHIANFHQALCIVADDSQWGSSTLGVISRLLNWLDDRPAPVLILTTADEEELAESPAEASQIQQLHRSGDTVQLPMGPLEPATHAALVREIIALRADLSALVEERTAGSPLFAVQLIGSWVARGALEFGSDGFVLRPGADQDLPASLEAVWTLRLDRVLFGLGADAPAALELAAALGVEFDEADWRAACKAEGLGDVGELVDAMVQARLFAPRPVGWAFVHSLLRATLDQQAWRGNRGQRHHQICSAILEDRHGPGVAERRARHLQAAGEPAAVIGLLVAAATERMAAGEARMAQNLMRDWAHAIERARIPAEDRRWGEGWLVWVRVHDAEGNHEAAAGLAERLERAARTWGWDDVRAPALALLGRNLLHRQDAEGARTILGRALSLARRRGDAVTQAWCWRLLGEIHARRGDRHQAADAYRTAQQAFVALGDTVQEGHCWLGMEALARQERRFAAGIEYLKRARASFEKVSSRRGLAYVLNAEGDVARLRGDRRTAEQRYREALEAWHAQGAGEALIAEVNLCLTLVSRGAWREARRILERRLQMADEGVSVEMLLKLEALLLPCVTSLQDWPALDANFERARRLVAIRTPGDEDVARLFDLTGSIAREAGRPLQAREAYLLAIELWTRLGHPWEADVARVAVRDLSRPEEGEEGPEALPELGVELEPAPSGGPED